MLESAGDPRRSESGIWCPWPYVVMPALLVSGHYLLASFPVSVPVPLTSPEASYSLHPLRADLLTVADNPPKKAAWSQLYSGLSGLVTVSQSPFPAWASPVCWA